MPKLKTTNPQVLLRRTIRQLCHCVKVEKHRAVMFMALPAVRLGLAQEVIRRVRQPKKRIVLVFAPSPAQADYWAGESSRNAFTHRRR